MAKAKKKAKKGLMPRHVDRLYKAVAHYVEKTGGKLVVIGGIQIIEWPKDGIGTFTLGIRCLGRKPQFAAHGGDSK